MPKIYRECIQCETDFYITERDQEFFSERELELPKRCWPCRQKNRREAAEAKANQRDQERSQKSGNMHTGRSPHRPESSNNNQSDPNNRGRNGRNN